VSRVPRWVAYGPRIGERMVAVAEEPIERYAAALALLPAG